VKSGLFYPRSITSAVQNTTKRVEVDRVMIWRDTDGEVHRYTAENDREKN